MPFMNVADVCLRACDMKGAIYVPFSLEGEWPDEEHEIVTRCISRYTPERVDAGYNNWRFTRYPEGYIISKRATWDMCWMSESAEDLVTKIALYYRPHGIIEIPPKEGTMTSSSWKTHSD